MRRRRRKPFSMSMRPRPGVTLPGKKDHLVCYLWGGNIRRGSCYIEITLGDWKDERDGVFCQTVNQRTDFGVHCPTAPYRTGFKWSDKEGRNVPTESIRRFYTEAKNGGYKFIHLVGFSGGGAIVASTLAHHSDKKNADMVKTLIVINAPIMERGQHRAPEKDKFSCVPHTDAAYYAQNIKARTLLMYADQEFLREGVAEWKKRKKADDWYYPGEHDFGKTKQSLEKVTNRVIEFLDASPDQGLRAAPLARPKRVRRKRKRRP